MCASIQIGKRAPAVADRERRSIPPANVDFEANALPAIQQRR
jgi:hypothetical protein